MSQTLIQVQEERKEIITNLIEQVEKLGKIKEFKEKIKMLRDILLDLYFYYQKCRPCFYLYTNIGTTCIVTKSLIEISCYNENDVQKIIERFFDDPIAETKLWKELRNIFDEFVTYIVDLLNKHEENDP